MTHASPRHYFMSVSKQECKQASFHREKMARAKTGSCQSLVQCMSVHRQRFDESIYITFFGEVVNPTPDS